MYPLDASVFEVFFALIDKILKELYFLQVCAS
jgi:hypothetical protein